MQVKMLFSCQFLQLTEPFNFIMGNVTFSPDKSIIKDHFSDEVFIHKIGILKYNATINQPLFGYYFFDFPEPISKEDSEKFNKTLYMVVEKVNYWWRFLWFSKDFCACVPEVYIYVPSKKESLIISNPIYYALSEGDPRMMTFSKEEIKYSFDVTDKYNEYMKGQRVPSHDDLSITQVANEDDKLKFITLPEYSYNNNRRIERAIILLTIAQMSKLKPMKIAAYIPILECLFCQSEGSEISHKVAERCAYYLENTKEARLKIFERIKEAYDVRSKFLHGAKLTEKSKKHHVIENQIEICKNIEQIVRKTLTKVIMQDSEKFTPEDITSFYKELLFS